MSMPDTGEQAALDCIYRHRERIKQSSKNCHLVDDAQAWNQQVVSATGPVYRQAGGPVATGPVHIQGDMGPCSTVSSQSNCRSRGCEFDLGQISILLWRFSAASADSRRVGVIFKGKYMHKVLVS